MGFIVASSKAELLQSIRQCVRELVDPKELDVVQFLQIQRRNLRLLLQRGNCGCFYYCLVCLPRDIYPTAARQKKSAGADDPLGRSQ